MPFQTVTTAVMTSTAAPSPAAPPAAPLPTAASSGFDRRAIPADAVVEMHPAPDGWPLRRVRWAMPDGAPCGSLLFVGGRGDHFEKYLETLEDWRRRGWQVESVDWRGQGGSGRFAADPHVGDIDDFARWIDDYAACYADWAARTPGPHVVAGHSMGGHLVLRAIAERRVRPDAAVLIAPMLGFLAPYPDWLGLRVAQVMCRIGDPTRAAWKVSEKPGSPMVLRQALLTHDPDRYADEQVWQAINPVLRLGPASWRWVREAYASFIRVAQSGVLEGVDVPILTLSASADKLVSAKATERQAARIPGAQLHVYGPEAAHELLREADPVRNDALARIDAFLAGVRAAG